MNSLFGGFNFAAKIVFYQKISTINSLFFKYFTEVVDFLQLEPSKKPNYTAENGVSGIKIAKERAVRITRTAVK